MKAKPSTVGFSAKVVMVSEHQIQIVGVIKAVSCRRIMRPERGRGTASILEEPFWERLKRSSESLAELLAKLRPGNRLFRLTSVLSDISLHTSSISRFAHPLHKPQAEPRPHRSGMTSNRAKEREMIRQRHDIPQGDGMIPRLHWRLS